MPFKRRRFAKRFRPRGSYGAKRGRMTKKAGYGTKMLDAVVRHAPTYLKFAYSYFCKQPFPDRYDTWLSCDNAGYIAAGSSTGNFGLSLSTPVLPYSKTGSVGVSLPNPFVGVATLTAAGVKNILFNAGTSTGLYNSAQVLGTRVEITAMPQSAGDSVIIAMAPLGAGAVGSYGSVITMSQGPNSVSKVAEFSVPGISNTLTGYYSLPSLLGQNYREYIANPNTNFTYTADPVSYFTLQFRWQTSDNINLANILTFRIKLMYHVLFQNRVDNQLLDS